MWIDDDRVLHTVALPDPTYLMTDEFRDGLGSIPPAQRGALQELVEGALMCVYETDWSDLPRSAADVGTVPPPSLLTGKVMTPEDVARAIDSVEPRWRLDAITALDDYIL